MALFLVFELTGAFSKKAPWRTASETTWDLEKDHPWRATGILGFLIGLAVHFRQRTKFAHAEVGGILIAWLARIFWGD